MTSFTTRPTFRQAPLSSRLFLLPLLAGSLCQSAFAGTTVTTDGKDKVTVPPQAEQKSSGAYWAVFGGANVGQSADAKHINVIDAKPQPAGTPAEIQQFRNTPGNDIPPTAVLIPNGTRETSPTFDTSVQNDIGWVAGLKLGYIFPVPSIFKPGVELEGMYNGIIQDSQATSQKALEGIRTSDRDGDELQEPFTNPDATVPKTKIFANPKDFMNSGALMFNAILKVDLGRFQPYIGGGVGVAYVTHDYQDVNLPKGAPAAPGAAALLNTKFIGVSKYDGGAVALLPRNHSDNQITNSPAGVLRFGSDNEFTFAYQALAGIDYVLSPRMSIFTEYKALFYYDGPYYRNLLNQEVTIGVRFGL